MKRLLLLLLLAAPLAAQDSDLRELLRDALCTEEVTRDPAAAAAQYEDLLARFRDQRTLAATALFRLAEVRRKQDRKEESVNLYQRLLTEFPEAGPEGKLARENLAALGAKTPAPGEAVSDEESLELARLTKRDGQPGRGARRVAAAAASKGRAADAALGYSGCEEQARGCDIW